MQKEKNEESVYSPSNAFIGRMHKGFPCFYQERGLFHLIFSFSRVSSCSVEPMLDGLMYLNDKSSLNLNGNVAN